MIASIIIATITFIAFLLTTAYIFIKCKPGGKTGSILFLKLAFISFSLLALVNLLDKLNVYLNNLAHIKCLFLLVGTIFLFSIIYLGGGGRLFVRICSEGKLKD